MLIINSYLLHCPYWIIQYYSPVRKAHLTGLSPIIYLIMAMLYIKEPFVMPYVSNMVGNYLVCLQVVFVETLQCMSAECFCCQRCVTIKGSQCNTFTAFVRKAVSLQDCKCWRWCPLRCQCWEFLGRMMFFCIKHLILSLLLSLFPFGSMLSLCWTWQMQMYSEQVRDVERDTFPPFSIFLCGWIGPATTVVYKCLL